MHRHEYAIQMGLPMLDDESLEPDPFMFHVAPDAGPDVTLGLLKTLYDNPSTYFANMKQLCKLCLNTYGVGTHYFDAGKMARLANLITAPSLHIKRPIRLTERGLRIVTAATRLQVDLIHFLLYSGWDERQPTLRGPLCTYRLACDILWQGERDKLNHARLLRGVRYALDARFEAIAEYQQLHLSLSGKSMRGATVWLERLCPAVVSEGVFAPRRDCPSELLVLGLGWVYRHHIPANWRRGNLEITLDPERREALARLCLLDATMLDANLDLALDRHRRYITDGGRGRAGQRLIGLHRLPSLDDDTLLGRGTTVRSEE